MRTIFPILPRAARQMFCIFALAVPLFPIRATPGAAVPWTTYEAEAMVSTGVVSGPQYGPNKVETESSGRKCVKLQTTGQYVEFTAQAAANALVVRYSVPDTSDGVGADYTISFYKNGSFAGKLPVTSKYSWLYGNFPFSNTPSSGSPRNFYDETRTNGVSISPGDIIRLQKDADDTATNYVIDLVDLENVAAPLSQPANSLSIMSYGAGGTGATDDSTALKNCISAAVAQGKIAWLPAGTYKITSSINLPSNLNLQGAGMWHTTLVGDPAAYGTYSGRITLNGNGSNIHLSDFAIIGKLNYRNDSESNDGLGGRYGTGSTISRIWVEHTKVGGWIVNSSGLVVDSCRFRDTIADGINFCVGMRSCTATNCTARGTGDDCFAMWPATYISATYKHGLNVFTHCTAQTPFLANGASIDGGESNRVEDSLFQDFPYGCGVLITTTFDVGTNIFSGTTVVQRCDLNRCGGYDAGYQWRAALQFCLDNAANNNISGVNLNNLNITNSVSDGVSIIGYSGRLGALTNAIMSNVSIPNYGLGTSGRHGLWARSDSRGSLTVSNSAVVEYLDASANFSFNFVTNAPPPAQNISTVTVASNSVTLTYLTTPGYAYHVESSSNLFSATWQTLPGSSTNAAGNSVRYTETNPPGNRRYYRTVSP